MVKLIRVNMRKFQKKYQVEIAETLQRIIEVKADSPEDAIQKIRKKYMDSEIVLDYSDYIDVDFSLYIEN